MKLLVFDCAGGGLDCRRKICAVMHEAFAARGRPVPPRARLLPFARSLGKGFAVLVRAVNFPAQGFVDRYREASAAMRALQTVRKPLFPGARETIESLAAHPGVGMRIAIGKVAYA